MTQNQLLYMQNLETNRANVVREAETKRDNIARLNEQIRSNQAQEAEKHRYNTLYINELVRSNQMREHISLFQAQESARHNRVSEALESARNTLTAHRNQNDFYLGLTNASLTYEQQLYQRELAAAQTEKTKAEVDLVGAQTKETSKKPDYWNAQTAKAQTEILLNQARTQTENEMRSYRKAESVSKSVSSFASSLTNFVGLASKLFAGGA